MSETKSFVEEEIRQLRVEITRLQEENDALKLRSSGCLCSWGRSWSSGSLSNSQYSTYDTELDEKRHNGKLVKTSRI
jgi:hypothetical protein